MARYRHMNSSSVGINGLFLGKPHTGTGKYLVSVLEHLVFTHSHTHFYIYCPSQTAHNLPHYSFLDAENVSITIVDVPFYSRDDQVWKYLWERIFLPREVHNSAIDIFWTPYHSTSRFTHIPHVMTVHDMVHHVDSRYLFNRRRVLYMNQADKAASQASHIFTVSHHSKNEISEYLNIPTTRITVTYLGAPSLSTPLSSPPLENPFILYVGGFDVRKNIPRLLEAFSLFVQNNSTSYRLVMPGSIPNSPLISNIYAEIKRLQLESYAVLPGSISEEMLHTYLHYADTLIYPSVYEGFGLPILEGMQSQTPVITANFGAMKEVSNEAAHCIDTRSVTEIYKALETVLHNHEYQNTLKEKGAQHVKNFTWEQTAHVIGNTLTSLES